ncbi:cathepsin B-like cysteine proteinase [Aphelenchoides avenae]|nr:cathepsin B-like cysteine proteinase [Aphelenchus avenae]
MTCVADILLGTAVLFSQPIIFFAADGELLTISNGFFANRSAFVDHMSIALYCMFSHINVVCIVLQFIMRYHLVCKAARRNSMWKYVAFAIVWCTVQASIAWWMLASDQSEETRDEAVRYLDELGWKYAPDARPYPTLSRLVPTIIHHGFYFVSCGGGYAVIIWCEYRMFKFLRSHGEAIIPSTRRLHAQVSRALISLAITPLVTLMGPILIIIGFNIAHKPAVPSFYPALTTMTSAIALINPITTMYFVRTYRMALVDLFKCGRKPIGPSDATVTKPPATDGTWCHAASAEALGWCDIGAKYSPHDGFHPKTWKAMVADCCSDKHEHALVDCLNERQTLWKAKYYQPLSLQPPGSLAPPIQAESSRGLKDYVDQPMPESFDVREKWSVCATTISTITNQGKCADCWAHASTAVMSDRYCICNATAAKTIGRLSAYALTSCCVDCSWNSECVGGYPVRAFNFWHKHGIVSERCQPWQQMGYPTCDSGCRNSSVDPVFWKGYSGAKQIGAFGKPNDQRLIQRELMARGPVTVVFRLTEDFYMHESGIFYPGGSAIGANHVVRILGWGVEKGIPYWKIANSYGKLVQEDGFFRMVRGFNAAGIEEYIVAGDACEGM